MAFFPDRAAAAQALIGLLPPEIGADWVVLGLPRGGVPIAAAIARHLGATLDVVVVRKVGVPGNPEVALAVVTGPGPDDLVVNEGLAEVLLLSPKDLRQISQPQIAEVARRVARWRMARPQVPLAGRDVLIVDDGLATGTTLAAALALVHRHGARKIAAAVPVALGNTCERFENMGITMICPHPAAQLPSVGSAYARFDQVSDDEVHDLLWAANPAALSPAAKG